MRVGCVGAKLRGRLSLSVLRLNNRTIPRAAGLVAIVGGAIGLAVYSARPAPPPGFDAGEPILLADVDNATGDSIFDESLISAASIGLRQSAQLSLLSRERVGAALRRMGVPRADSVRVLGSVAQEVALRENIGFTLSLRIEPSGQGYLLKSVLFDVTANEAIDEQQASAETHVGALIALDRLLQSVRIRLGEPRTLRRSRSLPLAQATTPSLEALRTYSRGSGAWRRGDYRLAGELWQRALDLDTGFAMAMGSLGSYYYFHQDRERGRRYFEAAAQRANRLTDWERLEMMQTHAFYRGDFDSAVVVARTMAARFPTANSWGNYGTSLMRAQQYDSAIVALERAAALGPYSNLFVNLATAAKALGSLERSIGYYERAVALDSNTVVLNNVNTEYGETLILAGRLDEAERLFRRMLDQPELFRRTLGFRGLGFLGLWRGSFDQAVGDFRRATEASRQQNSPNSTARGYLLEGLTLLLIGDTTAARRAFGPMVRIVESETLEPQLLALLGNGLLRGGQSALAERLLSRARAQRIDSTVPSIVESKRFLAAAIALTAGQSQEALDSLQGLTRYPQPHLVSLRRAEALAGVGDTTRARAVLDSVVAKPAITSESLFEWLAARRLAAELAIRQGDQPAALAGYQKIVEQWASGDSAAAALVQARARVRALDIRRGVSR